MGSKGKILIVDDDKEVLNLLEIILKHEKYNVVKAFSAEEALEKLESENVQLVISDIKMAGMSGIELLGELREWDMETPFIFISGKANRKDWEEAGRSTVSGMIEKPFRKEQVIKAVHKAFEEKENLSPI